MKLKPHDVLLVIGVRGTGKTRWTQENIVKRKKRVVVFDPHGEYETRETRTIEELTHDTEPLDRELVNLAVVSEWRTPSDLAEQFAIFCDLVSTSENLSIVVDEVGLLTRHGVDSVEYVACQSRHWNSPLILVAQRAVQIPKTAREQASKIISFRQSSPDDAAALVERCGEAAEKVRVLPRYQHFSWCEEDSFAGSEESGEQEE